MKEIDVRIIFSSFLDPESSCNSENKPCSKTTQYAMTTHPLKIMTDTPINGARERARWANSVEAWNYWAEPMAAMADRLNQPLLDFAGVRAGNIVLDLGAGVGEPALSAARRVAPCGRVVGLDLERHMLRVAKRRATALPVDFVTADMTRLPFIEDAFDCAVCRFGVMFVPNVNTALRETWRVLRSDGKAAFMVWGTQAENDVFEVLGRVVADILGEDERYPLAPLFRFAEPGSLGAAMTAAGFVDVQEAALRPTRKVGVKEPFWQATLDMVFGPRLAASSEHDRARVLSAIPAAFAQKAIDDIVLLAMHARVVSGRKP
ncbi:Methyltransferase [Azospirillaceae bacterium]